MADALYTIMIYADGNNDLEPEMLSIIDDVSNADIGDNINVIVMLSKQSRSVTDVMRVRHTYKPIQDDFCGTRIYIISKGKKEVIYKGKQKNMCQSSVLISFIEYCHQNYSAEKYILYVGGHGYQLVGFMTDYSSDYPCIMSIPQFASAIKKACDYLHIKIDLLIADTCYFNYIECLYELSHTQKIDYLMTCVIAGDIAGIKLSSLINSSSDCNEITSLIRNVTRNSQDNLITFELSYKALEDIKQSYNSMADEYITNKDSFPLNNILNIEGRYIIEKKLIIESLNKIVSEFINRTNLPLVDIATTKIEDISICNVYRNLSFCKDNRWTELICVNSEENHKISRNKPLTLSPQSVYSYLKIINPDISNDDQKLLYNKIVEVFKWKDK